MMDWDQVFKLFIISIVGTFVVMGVLTMIISLVSKILEQTQKQKKS